MAAAQARARASANRAGRRALSPSRLQSSRCSRVAAIRSTVSSCVCAATSFRRSIRTARNCASCVTGRRRSANRACASITWRGRRARRATCAMWPAALPGARSRPIGLDLVAVETDSGPLGDAQLYYLKRFWLASAAGAGESIRAAGGSGAAGLGRLCGAAIHQRDRAVGRLCAAGDRLFADLRDHRPHQPGVRRDRDARRLWGDRRDRAPGLARPR